MRNKSIFSRVIGWLGAVCLLCACCVPALAARPKYSYRVRVFAGQQGKINGQDVIEQTVQAGGRMNLYTSAVSLQDDSKYYVKGFRESGKGTEEIVNQLASFSVTKDQDYVVAYGLRGTMVEYTVNFQDAAGNTLAPSETYMGNVGDRPVVAHLYIEGYQPQSYNLTKTLVDNPMENVLTFVYTRVTTPVVDGGTTTIIDGGGATVVTPTTPVVPAAPTTPETPTTPEEGAGEGGEEEPTAPEGGEPAEPATPPEEGIPEENVPAATPETPSDLVDIDEGEIPLANVNATPAPEPLDLKSEGNVFWSGIPMWAKVLTGTALLGGIGTGLWFLLFYKKRKDEQHSMDITEITDINAIKDLMDDDDGL